MDASPTRAQAGTRGVAEILSLKLKRRGGALWVGCAEMGAWLVGRDEIAD